MAVKSSKANATHAATKRIEQVIDLHRSYFSDWRSDKFGRSQSSTTASDNADKKAPRTTQK